MQHNHSWQCSYCGHHQVLSEKQSLSTCEVSNFVEISEHNKVGLFVISIACLNSKCKKLTLKVKLLEKERRVSLSSNTTRSYYTGNLNHNALIKEWSLLPDSVAKPQPNYIPEYIRKDYEEACKIAHLSPNASAVLSRRCLECMIEDFCKIKETTLYQSIEKLNIRLNNDQAPNGVTEETITAIDSIRKMGQEHI